MISKQMNFARLIRNLQRSPAGRAGDEILEHQKALLATTRLLGSTTGRARFFTATAPDLFQL
jgi:hypothetical protein